MEKPSQMDNSSHSLSHSMRSKRRSRDSSSSSSSTTPTMDDDNNNNKNKKQSLSFPNDTIKDIFSRLPIKSITRFQSLSKSFSSFIHSSDFIAAHLRRSSRRPLVLVRCFHNPTSSNFSFSFLDRSSSPASLRDIDFPFPPPFFCFPRVVGSSLGLLCLDISPCYCSAFVLWNIAYRQFKTLPRPKITDAQRPFWMVSTGFGFNPQVNDFKLVRVVHFVRNNDEVLPLVRAEVFSWTTGSWRVLDRRPVEDSIGSCVINQGQQGVVVNGALHWVAFGIGDLINQTFIVSFDMGTEELRKIKIPNFVSPFCVKVLSFKGSLALAAYPVIPGGRVIDRFEFWVLDGGSDWTKLQDLPLPYTFGLGTPVGVLNESLLMVKRLESNCTNLSLIDPIAQTMKRFPICTPDYSAEFYSYVESLVPVSGGDVMEDEPH